MLTRLKSPASTKLGARPEGRFYTRLFFRSLCATSWIMLFQLLGGCSCSSSPSTTSRTLHSPSTTSRTLQVLVCTANVWEFQGAAATGLVKAADALRKPEDDVVVFGFQETNASHRQQYFLQDLPGYQVFHDGGGCSNTLAVFTKQPMKTHCTVVQLPQQHPATPMRYALLMDLSTLGIKIMSTHLLGGRYDDAHWMQCIDGREQQLATILQHRPAILIGDFNADSRFEPPLADYWQKLLQKAPGKTSADLRKYNTGAHQYLASKGYTTAIARDDLSCTTPFGTVVDWIYLDPQQLAYKIQDWGVVEGIAKDFSDHKFPWVRIEVILPLLQE